MCLLTEIVAIDGPAGAGKSTIARRLAEALDFAFLDTGAMYRAATWRAVHKGADLNDAQAVLDSVQTMRLELDDTAQGLVVRVDGEDVTQAIRTPEITRLIFHIDQNPAVREQLVALQRIYAQRRPTVAEGRDMGTVVFPHAKCKIFLDASLEVRTQRRARELEAKGLAVDLEQLRQEIHERDEKTRNRAVAPLRQAPDAVLVDTSHMTADEVVARLTALARERL